VSNALAYLARDKSMLCTTEPVKNK
jgi:hypothetical protein